MNTTNTTNTSKLLFLEPSYISSGLTNELYFIVYGIIDCINTKKTNLVINNFRLQPMTNKFCNIDDILNIHHLNILLKEYNIAVFDRSNVSFSIDSVTYGLDDKIIDITSETLSKFYTNNKLVIPAYTFLNDINGDPYPGQMKYLFINYTINGIKTEEKYTEYISNDIVVNLQSPTNIHNWEQIDSCYINNQGLFDYFLKNIQFSCRLVEHSENTLLVDCQQKYIYFDDVNFTNKKINVIHLRVEKDMTGRMLGSNKMTQEAYDMALQNKYIEMIEKYFSKNDIIFVLSYDLDNRVVKFLKDNEYEFYYTKKNIFDGREKHAIIDLLVGQKCNNCFIGNWNFDNMNGSTYSYILYVRNNADKNIFIDMYYIKEQELLKDNINFYNINNKTLNELVNNKHTDKNTTHSYLNLYENLLSTKKYTAKNILEIGIGYPGGNGGSIKMWNDYFVNANIYALDIQYINDIWDEIKNKDRIKLFTSIDAYDEINFKELFLDKNIKFDMMLDDGPHSLESMKQFIKLYSQLMTDDGILMIEDVQDIEWIEELKLVVPDHLKEYIQSYDLRSNNNRYDDIVFTINKNKKYEANYTIDGAETIQYIFKNNIDGVLVECGVDSGNFELLWIKELQRLHMLRDIYMFDTFNGLTEPCEYDHTRSDAILYSMSKDDVYNKWKSSIVNDETNNWCYIPLDSVKQNLNSTGYPENNLHYIVGDVLQTLEDKVNIPEKIAVLRLDTDWYESSKFELEKLYDNVVDGGLIIFDDYYHWEGQRKATDEFFEKLNIKYDFIDTKNGKTSVIIKK
jgi:predicted O-methyltransferase YrrM